MGFHFPQLFWFLIPLCLILGLYAWSRHVRRKDLLRLGEWALIQKHLSIEALSRRKTKDILALIGLFVLLVSSAGPQFGARLKEFKQRGMDVFVAIDTSRSMLAEDVYPSRLDHAKRSLGLLVDKLAGNRVGIIAFAKYPVIQCPLTTDTEAARLFLDIVDANTIPRQGTSIGDTIRLAINSFNMNDKTGKAIVLLTDGEDHRSDPEGAAKLAKEKGIVLFTLGIGTSKGEVIKDRDDQGNITAFHKFKGEMVLSRMDDGLLAKLASMTGGAYYHASTSDREIEEIARRLNDFDKKEFSAKTYERLQERYQFFAVLAFLLLLFEFFYSENPGQWKRIKWFFQSMIVLILLVSPVHADEKEHILKGNKLVNKKDFAGARAEFESAAIDAPEMPFIPYNIGLTYFAEGNFDEAKKQFDKTLSMTQNPDLTSKTHYNLGYVAYAQGNKLGAIEEFKNCLKINPQDMDAKYNIEYLKSGKTPKNPPQKPQQGDNNKDKNGNQKDQKQDQNKDQQSSGQEKQKKPGELSKEDAERILQMIKDQEKDKLKKAQAANPGNNKKDKKEDENGEDW